MGRPIDIQETLRSLESHLARGHQDWSSRAAADAHLSTEALVELALVQEANDVEDEPGAARALLVLQARANEDVAKVASALLTSSDPARRRLAAMVMREFPRLDAAPTRWSQEFVDALDSAVTVEKDPDALSWELAAIGWQKLPSALGTLLRFCSHPDAGIRAVVANNLLLSSSSNSRLPDEVAEQLLRFSHDQVAEVRDGVFCDVASFPELFEHHAVEYMRSASLAIERGEADAKSAKAALDALESRLAG